MPNRIQVRLWPLLLSAALGWVIWAEVSQLAQPLIVANVPAYTLFPSFEAESLNNRLWVSQTYRFDSTQPLARLVPTIRRSFRRNPYPETVPHGNSARVPVGWAYIELRNPTRRTRHLALSMPQYRCNQATLWVGRAGGDRFGRVGTLQNTTPLGERFYPFLNYAFPLTLPPQATLYLLLRTQNYASYHEVDVRLAGQRTYVETAYIGSIRDGVNVVVFLVLAVVALLVGWLSGSRLLWWFGVYLVSLSVMMASHVGYMSLLSYPGWWSVNADTTGTLFRIWINVMLHPFFYQMVKPAVWQPRRYKWAVLVYCAVCVGLMSLFLLPLHHYDSLNYGINLGMVTVSFINVSWLLVWSVLAYRRARIWSPLAICLLGLAPMVLSQLVSLLRATAGQDVYRQSPMSAEYMLFVLTYITFDQFRKELVTAMPATPSAPCAKLRSVPQRAGDPATDAGSGTCRSRTQRRAASAGDREYWPRPPRSGRQHPGHRPGVPGPPPPQPRQAAVYSAQCH